MEVESGLSLERESPVSQISAATFADRFVALILGSRDLPRRSVDLHVLLYSSVLRLQPGQPYSEREINEELQRWILAFGGNLGLDHVTLRRHLVDARILRRDPYGGSYQVEFASEAYPLDPSARSLDLEGLVTAAQQARAQRKQQHELRR